LMKISSKMAFENFKNFISFHETFKTKFSTHISIGDSPAVRDRRRVMGASSLSAVGYLFEVRAPVIVYQGGDVASIVNALYDIMFLFFATLSLYRRDRLLLYEFS